MGIGLSERGDFQSFSSLMAGHLFYVTQRTPRMLLWKDLQVYVEKSCLVSSLLIGVTGRWRSWRRRKPNLIFTLGTHYAVHFSLCALL
jgi:hypothetical protein